MTQLQVLTNHSGVSVRDLEAVREWYAAAFGFETAMPFDLPEGGRGAMLQAPGGARVELFEVEGSTEGLAWADPPAAPLRRGYFHVALEVSDLDVAFAAALKAGGASVWEPFEFDGHRMAFVHDPEGNLVELIG